MNSYQCPWCDKNYKLKQAVRDHCRVKHCGCIECNKAFVNLLALKNHNSALHSQENKVLTSNIAPRSAQNTSDSSTTNTTTSLIKPKNKTKKSKNQIYHEKILAKKEKNRNIRTIELIDAELNKAYYGYYLCRCGSLWESGHSYKHCYQECKKCLEGVLPYQLDRKLWNEDNLINNKPHRKDLCERCQKGLICSGNR
eukprot:TRINITY_DN10636_c0_g1_i1.p1 TRINITY_DN10636_c0_g1~~TRINITY_DN10636_c0_g1_i1.p1  ORF type:complete len:197 (+),score=10.98 TRINITY_DN10636_c0_g1_i1:63-653(+)